jgi:ParB family chromosome partitioning protein
MSRKDSRELFTNLLAQQDRQPPNAVHKTASPHLLKVAAGVRQIHEKGEALEKLLAEGDRIIEVEPDEVAPSSLQDRFDGSYDDAAIEEIVRSMKESGQIVPGLVRSSKTGDRPYQIVFGRRRLAAAQKLGIKFRAILRDLTDEQAIVFQGEENTNRNDLSFIEKCAFALLQERAGYKRDTIAASLSTGKSHVSEMLQIADSIPRETLMLVGRSPDIGRRRWIEFHKCWIARKDGADVIKSALEISDSAGGERFSLALAALSTKSAPVMAPAAKNEIILDGDALATITYAKSGVKLAFSKVVPSEFVDFVGERLSSLHQEFLMREKTNKEG